jgi:hypothetical protein
MRGWVSFGGSGIIAGRGHGLLNCLAKKAAAFSRYIYTNNMHARFIKWPETERVELFDYKGECLGGGYLIESPTHDYRAHNNREELIY